MAMKTGTGLAVIAIGAILAFAVTANTSVINLNVAGWVLMIIGVIGLAIPRRGYGLVVGGLARLLVPGRQRIGLILTIGIGIVAALLGGIITTAIIGVGHPVITFIVALVAAALLVSAFATRGYGRYRSRRRRLNWHW
jgi:uncharacterized membrane protein YeaQ/YmgE (transglycosylase-associated protein family)